MNIISISDMISQKPHFRLHQFRKTYHINKEYLNMEILQQCGHCRCTDVPCSVCSLTAAMASSTAHKLVAPPSKRYKQIKYRYNPNIIYTIYAEIVPEINRGSLFIFSSLYGNVYGSENKFASHAIYVFFQDSTTYVFHGTGNAILNLTSWLPWQPFQFYN